MRENSAKKFHVKILTISWVLTFPAIFLLRILLYFRSIFQCSPILVTLLVSKYFYKTKYHQWPLWDFFGQKSRLLWKKLNFAMWPIRDRKKTLKPSLLVKVEPNVVIFEIVRHEHLVQVFLKDFEFLHVITIIRHFSILEFGVELPPLPVPLHIHVYNYR